MGCIRTIICIHVLYWHYSAELSINQNVYLSFDLQLDAIMITFCTLMDIFPNTVGQMVKEGLITTVSNVIQENMQYTDLAD